MAEILNPKETMSISELTIAHVVHCRPGGDLGAKRRELRRQTPKADQAIPEPYGMTEVEDRITQAILDLLNANGLTARHAKALLGPAESVD